MINLLTPNNVIIGFLNQLIGEEGIRVITNLPEGEVTDEKIAEITGVEIQIVRRTLYILYESRLAIYRRERNKESGWLTYLWKVDLHEIDVVLEVEMRKLYVNLQKRLEFERNNVFYICDEGHRALFDSATEENFRCLNCGKVLRYQDNGELINALEERIGKIQAVLG
ncbi:MAG: transcription factor [Methanocellales archaeon]|nr:transcription factor [Methanocellales archaeon]MDD3291430.1 transcription factor [Methanocellales archaeon]MDD5234680.1 transcription factor [Methanocellales archaeon]MDD5484968.1 transcription factor [Methanocellales archaeon]